MTQERKERKYTFYVKLMEDLSYQSLVTVSNEQQGVFGFILSIVSLYIYSLSNVEVVVNPVQNPEEFGASQEIGASKYKKMATSVKP